MCTISRLIKISPKSCSVLKNDNVLFFFVNWRKSPQNIVDEVLNSRTDDPLHEILIFVDEPVEHVSNPVAHELADLVVQKKTGNFKLNHDADFCLFRNRLRLLYLYLSAAYSWEEP